MLPFKELHIDSVSTALGLPPVQPVKLVRAQSDA